MITLVLPPDDYTHFRSFRLVEEWTYHVESGNIDIQIVGIAPVNDEYRDDGTFRGPVPLCWLKYGDVKNVIAQYTARHKANSLYMALWRSYTGNKNAELAAGSIQTASVMRAIPLLDTTDYYYSRKVRVSNDTILSKYWCAEPNRGKYALMIPTTGSM